MEKNDFNMYNLLEEFEAIDSMLELDEGEISEEYDDLFSLLDHLLKEQSDSCGSYLSYLKAKENQYGERVKELAAAKKMFKTKQEKFRKFLTYALDRIGKKKIQGDIYTISKKKGVQSLDIVNEKEIPFQYMKEIVDETCVKKALKNGEDVPGCKLITGDDSIGVRLRARKGSDNE